MPPPPPNSLSASRPPAKRRMNAVGPTVRRLRVEKGWSQEELAAKLQVHGWDCTRSWLAKIEARQVLVRDHQLLHLRAVLGVTTLEELFPTLNARRALRAAPLRAG